MAAKRAKFAEWQKGSVSTVVLFACAIGGADPQASKASLAPAPNIFALPVAPKPEAGRSSPLASSDATAATAAIVITDLDKPASATADAPPPNANSSAEVVSSAQSTPAATAAPDLFALPTSDMAHIAVTAGDTPAQAPQATDLNATVPLSAQAVAGKDPPPLAPKDIDPQHPGALDPPAVSFDLGGSAPSVMSNAEGQTTLTLDARTPPPGQLARQITAERVKPEGGATKVVRLGAKPNPYGSRTVEKSDLNQILGVVFGDTQTAAAEAEPKPPAPEQGFAVIALEIPTEKQPDDARDVIDTITLGDLVSRATHYSEDLRADKLALASSKMNAASTLSQLGPRFDGRFGQGHEHSFSSVNNTPVSNPDHSRTDASMVMVQPLFDSTTIASISRDRQLSRAGEMHKRSTEVTVSSEAVSNYFDLLEARLQLEISRAYLDRMNSLVDYMRKRTEGGGSSEADLERVKSVALSAQRAVVDAKGGLDAALTTMEKLTGVVAVQIAVPNEVFIDLPADPDSALADLIKINPDIRAAYIQIKAARDDALGVVARTAPKFNLEMGRYESTNASGTKGATVDDRLMLTGTISLGAGTEFLQGLAQSEHQSELKHRYYALIRNAHERLSTAYLQLKNLQDQEKISWQEFKSNNRVAVAFDEQLFSANRSLLDVLDTYQKYYQSKANIVRISIAYLRTAYQIRQLIGDLNTDNVGDEPITSAQAGG